MKSLLLLTTALLVSGAYAQEPKPLSGSQVKLRADAPILFAPRGWKIEQQIRGDLNRDKLSDTALILVEDKPTKDKNDLVTARQRAFVVLLKTGKGWTRAGFNGSLLQGTRDGGAFYGFMQTPVTVTIEKGVLKVFQDNGSREMSERTHKFRFDARKNAFFLIGSEVSENDRITGDGVSTSVNYLTGVKLVGTYNPKKDATTTVKSRVSKKLRSLESMTLDQRYTP